MKYTERTKKGGHCKNNARAGRTICKFHFRMAVREVSHQMGSLEQVAKRDIKRFWKTFGTVMGVTIVVFGICLIARYYFGFENLPR